MDTRKYIIIPEYKPLYAMRKCWGPTHGPLNKPTLTPVDVIGELLLQKPPENLTIYEVEKQGDKFSEYVRLTLENYRLPYGEIASTPSVEEPSQKMSEVPPAKPAEPVVPVVVPADHPVNMPLPPEVKEDLAMHGRTETVSPENVEQVNAMPDEVDSLPTDTVVGPPLESEPVMSDQEDVNTASPEDIKSEEHATDGREFVVESSAPVTGADAPAASADDPYAGMSNKQRKKAKREAARLAAADAAATEVANND